MAAGTKNANLPQNPVGFGYHRGELIAENHQLVRQLPIPGLELLIGQSLGTGPRARLDRGQQRVALVQELGHRISKFLIFGIVRDQIFEPRLDIRQSYPNLVDGNGSGGCRVGAELGIGSDGVHGDGHLSPDDGGGP